MEENGLWARADFWSGVGEDRTEEVKERRASTDEEGSCGNLGEEQWNKEAVEESCRERVLESGRFGEVQKGAKADNQDDGRGFGMIAVSKRSKGVGRGGKDRLRYRGMVA